MNPLSEKARKGNIATLNGNSFASYDSGNKFSSVTSGTYAYTNTDLITLSGPSIPNGTFNYEGAGDLTQQRVNGTNSTSYRYDGLGRRVYSTGPRYYIYDGDKLVGELLSGTANIAYTWGADGLVSERLIPSNKSLYYHFGPQGETRQLTNSSGTVVDTYLYNAYGKTIATTGTDTNHHRYGGKYGYYTDGANGIILAGLRWYHPAIMRWLTRDPIQYEGGTNMYAYVGGNPVRYVDPEGLDALDNLSDFVVGFGDNIFGIAPFVRRTINWSVGEGWEDPVVDDSPYYQGGGEAGDAFETGVGCMLGARALAELTHLKHLRFLNQNRFFRVGYSKRGATLRPRIGIGPNYRGRSELIKDNTHIDLRILGPRSR